MYVPAALAAVPAGLAAVAGAVLGRSGRTPSNREPAPPSAEGRSALTGGRAWQ